MNRPDKPARTVTRARKLRRELSLPEAMLWQHLRGSPEGLKFRKQHPAGPFVLDFFCARANLAIEIDGLSHVMGTRPERDSRRDDWLLVHRIAVLRIPASEVLADVQGAATAIVGYAKDRLETLGKTPPSSLRDATSPSQVDGED